MLSRKEILENKPLIIGGPCSVTSKEQIVRIATAVEEAGAHGLRAQLWKPRTSPDSFQGVGETGLDWIQAVKDQTNLIIMMEVMSPKHIELTKDLADVLWVGSRNMQNFHLLKAISEDPRPVILKRGLVATMKEWLGSADYCGREKVILCERGVRSAAGATRFTLDLNTALVAIHDHDMPVIIDPSHPAGRRDLVPPLAAAGAAIGADGVVIETHYDPETEPVDSDQTVTLETFKEVVHQLHQIYAIALQGVNNQIEIPAFSNGYVSTRQKSQITIQ